MAKEKFFVKLKDWLIGVDEDEDDDDYIDPIVENRRRESFERPQPKPAPRQTKPVQPVKQAPKQAPKPQPVQRPAQNSQQQVQRRAAPKPAAKPAPKPKQQAPKPQPKKEAKVERKDNYIMTEIISPMNGIKVPAEKQPEVRRKAAHKKKFKMNQDELIPVISPMFGPSEEEEQQKPAPKKTEPKKKPVVTQAKKPAPKKEKAPAPVKKPQKPDEVINNVEDRLKNISSLAEETQDDLKIIEERTGKFKLDFKKDDDSLIDEIDDNMSLDELMNLYEKKFK